MFELKITEHLTYVLVDAKSELKSFFIVAVLSQFKFNYYVTKLLHCIANSKYVPQYYLKIVR